MCQAFRMPWREWKEHTPPYVQRVWADLLNIQRRVENDRVDRQRAIREREAGGMR